MRNHTSKSLMLNPFRVCAFILVLVTSGLLFIIKYHVQVLKREVTRVENQIISAQEDIHILRAEWSYLTQPENLTKLIQEDTKLVAIEPNLIMRIKLHDIGKINKLFKPKTKIRDEGEASHKAT